MSFTKTIEFANYTLNFGEDKVLLDAFDCIVFLHFSHKNTLENLKIQNISLLTQKLLR